MPNIMKKIVFLFSFASLSLAIPRDEFYSFGPDAGDTAVGANDDGSSGEISLQFGAFLYFDEEHTTLYVNNNGDISFAGPVTSFTPSSFPLDGFSLIAPYWGDVDTRGTGTVYYRETTNSDILRRARDDIGRAFSIRFVPTFAFIATWDRVGHYNQNTERIATFQCVLMTDGTVSYVKFLYADGEIQWTTGDASSGINGFGGVPAQVGFDAGDGERFFSVPGSQTNEIVNIASTTNVNVPGVWTFRVNGDVSSCSSIEDRENSPLIITPRVGSVLGGTAVTISSICLDISDTITCQYEGFNAITADIQEPDTENEAPVALCVSPAFPQPGSKQLRILVVSQSGETKYDTSTRFYAGSVEESNEVQIQDQQSPLVNPHSTITITWDPRSFLPANIVDPASLRVNLVLVLLNMVTLKWEDVPDGIVNPSHENIGEADVEIATFTVEGVQPISIQIRIDLGSVRRKRVPDLPSLENVILWSPTLYYSMDDKLRSMCSEWADAQPADIGEQILGSVLPCAPTLEQARFPNSGLIEDTDIDIDLYHKGTDVCFRTIFPSDEGYGQQCCYDSSGFLVVGHPGGSVDLIHPLLDMMGHIQEDVLPSVFCCEGEFSDCSLYYSKRPSDDGSRYNPFFPAWLRGDPHMVTLDGFQYTFNGRGEFLLVQVDNVFILQARMIQLDTIAVGATVFSAIAIREGDNTVQFQVGAFAGDPDVLLNGEFIDFTNIPTSTQQFNGVAVTKVDSTLSASFASGAFIEVREDNGFFSPISVSLPTSWQGQTRGLMGNYNEDTSDDLTPQTVGDPLPLDSDLRTIHDSFGVTWIISDQQDSIFSYSDGDSFTDYFFPSFEPTFEVTFSDASLEQSANDICGDDFSCRFDIATTGSTTIGLSTLMGGQELDMIVSLSAPTVCTPPCVNGACVATNACSCSMGYTAPQCDIPIITECDTNVCQNGGSCSNVAGSVICSCLLGYGGSSCEIEECDCSTSVYCSMEGELTASGTVDVFRRELRCIFSADPESSMEFATDESLLTMNRYLSSGSVLSTLLRAAPRDDIAAVPLYDCSVPGGIGDIEQVNIMFTRDDGTAARERVRIDSIDPAMDVGDMNRCALFSLIRWLSTQPSPLSDPQCRQGGCGRNTNIFFTVECPF